MLSAVTHVQFGVFAPPLSDGLGITGTRAGASPTHAARRIGDSPTQVFTQTKQVV
jgi:hypothetical protein